MYVTYVSRLRFEHIYILIYFSKVLKDRTVVGKWNMKVGIVVVEFKFFSLNRINSWVAVKFWTSGLRLFFFHSVWTLSGSEFWERHVVSGTTKLLAPTPFSPCKWPSNLQWRNKKNSRAKLLSFIITCVLFSSAEQRYVVGTRLCTSTQKCTMFNKIGRLGIIRSLGGPLASAAKPPQSSMGNPDTWLSLL